MYEVESKEINYLGKKLKAKSWVCLTDSHYNTIKNEYYQKPYYKNVVNEFINISKGGVKTSNITRNYVKDLMAKTRLHYCKWSVEEAMESKDVMGYFYAGILNNKKMFGDNLSENTKIEKRISLGGKGVASNPKNFPIKTVREVLEKYNINNKYYDFSCGWGARLLGAMSMNIDYFGTDPNYLLTERLLKMANDYKENVMCNSSVDIRTQGSEIFIPEWENTIGVAFTSPPYFYLEDYKIGKQSFKNGMSYNDWIDYYLRPTIENIEKYLIVGGTMIININNFDDYDLVNDVIEISEDMGFKHIETMNLKNIKRTNSHNGFNDNSEGLMVFKNEEDWKIK